MRPFLDFLHVPSGERKGHRSRRVGRLAGLVGLVGPLGAACLVAGATVTAVLAAGVPGGPRPGGMAPTDAPALIATGAPADEFQAGQPGLIATPLSLAAATAQSDRAARTGAVLGLPAAARRSATHVVDRFGGRAYDEVTEYDSGDRLISMQRFDPDGQLVAAVRFGWHGDGGAALHGAAGARVRAERLVAELGLGTVGAPRIVAAPSNAGWTVAWDRAVGGIPVRGDGVRIQLWPDGSVHGLSRSERALSPRPTTVLDRSRAAAVLEAQLDRWFRADVRGLATTTGLELAWVAPNDTFAPAGLDGAAPVLRLAWVARVGTTGLLAQSLRALEVYVDAGNGSIIGGDVLQ